MTEKTQAKADVSNGAKPVRPEIKREDSDRDFDDYFVSALKQRIRSDF